MFTLVARQPLVSGSDKKTVDSRGGTQLLLFNTCGQVAEYFYNYWPEQRKQPGHGGLGAAEQLCDHRLSQVVPQVQQHRHHRPVQAQTAAAEPNPFAESLPDE